MSRPLSYETRYYVLRELSFLKRKELYNRCPSLRAQEQRAGYKIDKLKIEQRRDSCQIEIDSFRIRFENKNDQLIVSTASRQYLATERNLKETAERWILYTLGRPGTKIRNVELVGAPKCIRNCPPITIINLTIDRLHRPKNSSWIKTTQPIEHVTTNRIMRDENIKTARKVTILLNYVPFGGPTPIYEWEAQQISYLGHFDVKHILGYCIHIKKTGGRIGFKFETEYHIPNLECMMLDWMAFKLNARKTFWNGRKCFTIPLDEFSELNGHGNLDNYSTHFILEVNPKGTAIRRLD